MAKKRKHLPHYTPKIIGYYPRQVVALRIPAQPDPAKVRAARQHQINLAKSISSPYA